MITIPCNCILETPDILIYSSEQCLTLKDPIVFHLHSIAYLSIPELLYAGTSVDAQYRFDPNILKLNISTHISDHTDFYSELQDDLKILEEKTPKIDWTSPYHSLWYYVILLIIIVSCILGVWIIYRCYFRNYRSIVPKVNTNCYGSNSKARECVCFN